ncbi:109R [Cherax quadricarinatus iridovirus]|uniref:Ribonuclease III n=1 Tax=Shrimp hemocyte iridescent virus TaxID=2039780 RepID=A0A291B0P4_9VIRU|nr:109R [Cherax quadricarinatus iridovirus]YP_010084797.1 ribonuclease III [Shrimp hemocyte iridescent virus]UPA43419.1 ribonuclease III [Iridovirus CN01]ASZ85089.1 109R [Cherax quadricarinatus iridovirus]ATE87054.1 ribonuclease III [Shrimp hemocyte iridescent virus]UPA43495.1 ribonuclease III [Iridovirus CN01]UPA43691.1 ribonuclease III [Iridovirus CN01]
MASLIISKLNEYCQKKNIPYPVYKITNMDVNIGVTVKLEVEGAVFTNTRENKTLAKIACAEQAVRVLNVDDFLENYKKMKPTYRIVKINFDELWDNNVDEVTVVVKRKGKTTTLKEITLGKTCVEIVED